MTALTALRVPARALGAEAGPVTRVVDARWLMAYAAGLGETDACYYDTLAAKGPAAHPLFPVCYEWPPLVSLRERVIGEKLAPFSVHATHELAMTRMPRAGETITTTARVIAIERRRSGTLLVARLGAVDSDGCVLTTTDYGSVYRGVEPEAVGRIAEPLPRTGAVSPGVILWEMPIGLAAGAAHIYTECARIWNPIHTDVAAARAAGLPGIILHGTATLALAVSRMVTRELGGDPSRVGHVHARFTGFVRVPSTLTVRCRGRNATTIAFDAVGADGAVVLSDGVLGP